MEKVRREIFKSVQEDHIEEKSMKASLAMALHFHQPTGNFDDVIERASDNCYIPFLETLKKYPEIKMTLHFSGCLLEWAEENRPQIIEMVRDMAKSGQVEIMTGGFYEPILISIPPKDRKRQIEMLTEYVKDKFSVDPAGAWVAERIWEPALPSVFHDAGVKYVILDDTHFLYAGVPKEKTYGYYMTEDNGKEVAVFASDKVLRYSMPYKLPHECTGYMREVAEKHPGALFVYGDDGEKFGEWPGTHKWVYEEKWLENFLNELMANRDWLETVKLSECLASRKPEGTVYLPASSYEEMLEWSLPVDVQEDMEDVLNDIRSSGKEEFYKPFIRGGFWRNFLSKYPETNHMNKKMLYVSGKLENVRDLKKKPELIEEAEKELFRGQCNCAYWHGVFGGLYLYHLRNAVYEHLIKGEALIDQILLGSKQCAQADVRDIDADGLSEVVLENRDINLYFSPEEGGVLKEFDSKKIGQNFINTLRRKKEAYHRKIIKKLQEESLRENANKVKTIHDDIQAVDPALREHLNYDWYGRYSLVDHFISSDVTLDDFSKSSYNELGDFIGNKYEHELKKTRKGFDLLMKREGKAGDAKVRLEKKISFPSKGASFEVEYTLTNLEENKKEFIFGPEFNVIMPDADSDKYKVIASSSDKTRQLGYIFEAKDAENIEIKDTGEKASLLLDFSQKCNIWHFPVKTVSQSEQAYELNYQGSSIFPHLRVELDAGGSKKFGISVNLRV